MKVEKQSTEGTSFLYKTSQKTFIGKCSNLDKCSFEVDVFKIGLFFFSWMILADTAYWFKVSSFIFLI